MVPGSAFVQGGSYVPGGPATRRCLSTRRTCGIVGSFVARSGTRCNTGSGPPGIAPGPWMWPVPSRATWSWNEAPAAAQAAGASSDTRPSSSSSSAALGTGSVDDGDDPCPDGEQSSSAGTSDIRSLLRRRARHFDRPKSSIGSVRIEDFSGDRKRYLKWKRAIEAQEQLYKLDATELTMLVYLSTKGEARDVLDSSE